MYTELKNNLTGEVDGHFIRRNSDGAVISKNDMGNDYQAYLAWKTSHEAPVDAEQTEHVDAEQTEHVDAEQTEHVDAEQTEHVDAEPAEPAEPVEPAEQ